jgi:hypothetical protein
VHYVAELPYPGDVMAECLTVVAKIYPKAGREAEVEACW